MTIDDENRPARQRVTLTGISSRAWEHPADRGALTALRSGDSARGPEAG